MLLINTAEHCTSTCCVSWDFCWPSAGLCQASGLKVCSSVSATFPTLVWSINIWMHKFCLTIKAEDENIKQHQNPYWFPNAQLILSTSWIWSHWFLPFKHSCQANFEYISIQCIFCQLSKHTAVKGALKNLADVKHSYTEHCYIYHWAM